MNNVLPQAMDSNGLIFVKLKKKLILVGILCLKMFVKDALEYMESVNPFYYKVLINMDNISKELLSLAYIDMPSLIMNPSLLPMIN